MSDFARYDVEAPRCGVGPVLLFIFVVAASVAAFAVAGTVKADSGARIAYVDEQRPWTGAGKGGDDRVQTARLPVQR